MALFHLGKPNDSNGMLWTAAGYLYRYHKFHWVASLPRGLSQQYVQLICSTTKLVSA